MKWRPEHVCRWCLAAGLLLAILGWCCDRWLAAEPGSAEEMFARVQVGMTREEVVAIFRRYWNVIDGYYSEGTTTQGRSWSRCHIQGPLFEDLPPTAEVDRCMLTVLDRNGQHLEVVFGADGLVSEKRLDPGVLSDRLERVSRTLTDAAFDLSSAEWWRQQAQKTCRSLRRKGPHLIAWVAVGGLVASGWLFRRYLISGRPVARS